VFGVFGVWVCGVCGVCGCGPCREEKKKKKRGRYHIQQVANSRVSQYEQDSRLKGYDFHDRVGRP
jgi:hypothetical protein